MLLIHAAGVVNVCVNFTNVIEITSRLLASEISGTARHITGAERSAIGRFQRVYICICKREKERTFISVIS